MATKIVGMKMQDGEIQEIKLKKVKKELKDKNVVVAEGKIIHMNEVNGVLFLKLIVLGGKKRDIRNYPSFVCIGEVKDAAQKFNLHDKVHIEGYMTSRKVKTAEGVIYQQSIRATKVTPMKSILEQELGEAGKIYEMPFAQFKAVGEVVKVNIGRNNIIKLVICSLTDEVFPNYIEYTMFANNLEPIANCLKIGTTVCVVGEIQTNESKSVVDGKKRFFQSNVVLDIKKI